MYQSLPSTSSQKPAAPKPQQPQAPQVKQPRSFMPSVNRPRMINKAPRQLPGVPTSRPGMTPVQPPPQGTAQNPIPNPSMIGTAPSPQIGTPVQGSMLPVAMPQQNQGLMFDPNSDPTQHPEGMAGWLRDREAYRASMANTQFNPNSNPTQHPEGMAGWLRDRNAYRAAQGQAQANGQQGILTGFSGGATTTFDPALVARIMKQRSLQTAPQIAPMA